MHVRLRSPEERYIPRLRNVVLAADLNNRQCSSGRFGWNILSIVVPGRYTLMAIEYLWDDPDVLQEYISLLAEWKIEVHYVKVK